MLRLLFALLTLLEMAEKVQPFAGGAPTSTCFTMYPHHHGHPQQETEMPYTLRLSQQSFRDNDLITIVVSANNSSGPIRGIMLGARRATANTEDFVGHFTSFPADKIKAFNCFGGFQNMITHANNDPVTSLRFQWRAPNRHVGSVVFWATLMEHYETFWVAQPFPLPTSNPNQPIVQSIFREIPTTNLVNETDFSECGDTKGCFFYPSHCDGHDCIAAVSYRYRPEMDDYYFEMFTKEGPNYLSLGFSSDETMGDDFTASCVANSGNLSVQQGRNPDYYNELQFTRSITEREIMQKDGDIHCRFGLSVRAAAYLINQSTPAFQFTEQVFNLSQSWHLFLAWGHANAGSDVMDFHVEMPAISYSKINLRDASNSYGSAFHIMVRVHASLMIIAWVLFTGLVTVIARHYKEWFPKKRLFGTKVWFQVHRALAILVAILTIIGIIIIFKHYGTGIRDQAGNHAKVGLAVLACVCVQIIVGFLRPGPESKVRPFFNWGHRILGHASHILSAVTMFLAFDIDYITSDLKDTGFITLGVWVGGQILWHIIFEVYSFCYLRRTGHSTAYDMGSGAVAETTKKERSAICDNVLITLYILCLLGFTASIMVFFLLY